MNAQLLAQIQQAHQHYQTLIGQRLKIAPHRERLWYEWFKAGYQIQDLETVVIYLKKEIRLERRHIGALKLSNLLNLDRFEEDLAISRINLRPAPKRPKPNLPPSPLSPKLRHDGNQQAVKFLRTLKHEL